MTGKFINVDIEIFSERPLGRLKKEFEELGAYHLYCGRHSSGYLLTLEKNTFLRATLERRLVSLCRLVERLSPKGRKLWDAATVRSFDIGIEASVGNPTVQVAVPPALLQRIVALGGTVAVTVYAPETYSP